MIADVAHQPGALPLLQYALTELFEHRDEDRLTLAAYQEIGGSPGLLRSSRTHLRVDRPERPRATKQVFLRLVTLGRDAGHPPARHSGELDALDVDQEAIDSVRHLRAPPAPDLDREPPPGSPRSRSPMKRC